MCGWQSEHCLYDGRLNATQQMLDQALKNLEEKFLFVGITEEWDATIEMMEKLLPTYFEGFHANISADTCHRGDDQCARPPQKEAEETSNALTVPSQELSVTSVPALDNLLLHFVWADLILYEKAKELFYDRAMLCGVKTLSNYGL